jgi:arylsulfatase A-like enzyme
MPLFHQHGMPQRWWLGVVTSLLWAAWSAAAWGQPPAKASRPPNIVYFLIDELGYYELSCLGHPEHRTPHIDRLAAEGVRLTQCLAGGPVCAPTRCALLTGKHGGHMTIRANGGFDPLREGEVTLGTVFQRAGYATGGFGKWGNGARGTSGVPEKHGFDVFFGYYDQVHAHTFFPKYLIRNSQEVPLPGNTGDPQQGQTFSQYVIFEESCQFIRQHKDRPFFAYLCWTPPHGRWGIPEDDPSWQLYKDKPWSRDARIYAAMVNLVDRQVGQIRDLLRELGLEDQTIVILSGDNGANRYFPDEQHPDGLFSPNVDPRTGVRFRGFKGQLYEGGLRVPFLVHWPGRIAGGRVSDHLCYFPDVMPTLCELAGVTCPTEIDGLSLAPTLLGQASGRPQPQHEYLYWEHLQQVAVRQGNWKAIRPALNAPWELYDLAHDVSETHNLAAQHPDVLARLQRLAEEAHRPAQSGDIYDRALVEKDRNYFEGQTTGKAKAKKGKAKAAAAP